MDGSNEIREIKKEIIEARGLIIKSNNLASSLNAEVRGIAKRQAGYERTFSWNSVTAYVLFAVLAWGGVQLLYNYRHAAEQKDLKAEKERADKAEAKLKEIEKETGPTDKKTNENALAIFELVRNKDRQAAIDAYDALDKEKLTPLESKLLEVAVDSFRNDLSMEHFAKGQEFLAKNKYAEAVEEFRACLRYKDDAGHSTAAKIQMANAMRLLGKPREAIALLQRLTEEHLSRELSDDALWYLALAHKDAHQKDEAKTVLRSLLRQFPDSVFYRDARVKLADLQIHPFLEEQK